MALAQRLNELALANSEGLLSDDEYRLLRQNLFEQHSTAASVPIETPVVPITRPPRNTPTSSTTQRLPPSPSPSKDPQRVRLRSPITIGVANLLKRAAGRRTTSSTHDPIAIKDAGTKVSPVHDSPKRSVITPRRVHKKPVDLSLRIETPVAVKVLNSPRKWNISDGAYPTAESPLSPTGSFRRIVPRPEDSVPIMQDVFDDSNLISAKDIRSALAITEDEARRLVDAFNNLEASTLRRIQKQKARRLPTSTPTNINILLEGREWREHRLIPSPSSPLLDNRRRIQSYEANNSDGLSIRSGSSNKTSLSQSKSISSFPKQAPSSPLSAHFPTSSMSLHRKNSVSSMSSQSTSFTSAGMLGIAPSSPLSRSATHLPLRKIAMASTDTVGLASPEEDDHDDELLDIRRRREDLVARYTSRLEFLRAKLKGAELHEKLLRK